MSTDRREVHAQHVDAWIARNAGGLPNDRLVLLFGEAIEAVRNRALATLSEVTFDAVFERVLLTCQKKNSLLAKLTTVPVFSTDALAAESDDLTSAQIQQAFRSLLIELLSLLGNLTGEVLTKPLHRELSKVTVGGLGPKPKAVPQRSNLRSVKGGSEEGNQ